MTAAAETDSQMRRNALRHAEQFQRQKELSLRLLEYTETLMDYPLETKNAASPAPSDAETVKAMLQSFQPSDFDSLIEERNIAGNCGYILCPLPHRQEKGGGLFRIIAASGRRPGHKPSGGIVDVASLEMWCSDECRKRAMYLRVQLNEEPAWVREGQHIKLELLEEAERRKSVQHEIKSMVKDLKALSVSQNGEQPVLSPEEQISQEVSRLQIREKGVDQGKTPQPPKLSADANHRMIDGFETKDSQAYKYDFSEEDDDDMDFDFL